MRYADWGGRSDRGRWILAMTLAIAWTLFVMALLAEGRGPGVLVTLPLIFVAPGAIFLAARARAARRLAHRLEADADELAVRVSVSLVEPRLELGSDEGMLCHEDGWLIFRGERTEWSVRTGDVYFAPGASGWRYLGPEGGARFVLLDPIRRGGDLAGLLARWSAAAPGPGEPVYPGHRVFGGSPRGGVAAARAVSDSRASAPTR